MRKIFSFLALIVCALAVNAASITAPKVDFGTVSIKGQSLPVSDSKTVTVTFSGLATDGYSMYAEVSEGLLDDETNPNGFYVSPATQYLGYGVGSGTLEFTVSYSVKAAGTYTGKLHWSCYDTGYEEVNGYTDITITVTNDAIVPKVTLYEAVNSIDDLSEGDEVVFFQGNYKQVCAPFNSLYTTSLPGIDAEYADLYHTQVYVPEGAQSFKLIKNSNKWIFHTDAYNLGANDKTLTQGVGAIDWSISFDNYTAIIKPDKSDYVIQFNSDRFKLYDAGTQSSITLLKRIGDPVAIESKLEVADINFGDVEQDDEDYVTISFTTENIDGGVLWDIVGADKDLFSLDESKADQGTLYINYLGTATKTGSVDAQLYAYYQNVSLDDVEEYFDININLVAATVKLTDLAFAASTPTTIDQGQSIDLAPFVLFTPGNAEDKSLSWATDHDYQGTITDAGVLTAKHVTGTITVTITSVRVPSVSATHTLTITEPVVTDFTLSDAELTMNIGDKKTISVTARVPEYALNAATFLSLNTDIATVHGTKGEITAKAIGDATIVAKIGDVEKECLVHVVPVTITNFAFNVSETTMTVGGTLQLNPIIEPAAAADQWTISWSSGNPEVASIDENGLVKAHKEGEAEITATMSDKEASMMIYVVAPKTFAKVSDPADLADKDTIILATIKDGVGVVAGPRDDKKLTLATQNVSVTETEAYADDAIRFVLAAVTGGFELTPVGASKPIAVTASGNDITNKTASNCPVWEFVADGDNGVYVHNTGNTNAYFKYHQGNAAIKPYKSNTAGAVYVYVYVRKYVDPTITGVETIESNVSVQKILRDGQIVIMRNGVMYSIDGKRL